MNHATYIIISIIIIIILLLLLLFLIFIIIVIVIIIIIIIIIIYQCLLEIIGYSAVVSFILSVSYTHLTLPTIYSV